MLPSFLRYFSPASPRSDTDVYLRSAAATTTPYPAHQTLVCAPCDVKWAAAGGTVCFVCGHEGERAA